MGGTANLSTPIASVIFDLYHSSEWS